MAGRSSSAILRLMVDHPVVSVTIIFPSLWGRIALFNNLERLICQLRFE
jgi:hypothetical protein